MQPIRRNKKFKLNYSKINFWHQAGPGVTQFFNAMSLFFPAGERYFIRSVRAYLPQTPDFMKEQISAFIGQEAFHGREHENLNEALSDYRFLNLVENALELLSAKLPKEVNLAATVSLEHITSILAQGLLENIDSLIDSDPQFRDLWIWHALEETEHKAVAFDQYRVVVRSEVTSYLLRTIVLTVASLVFAAAVVDRYTHLLRKNNQLTVLNVLSTINWLLVRPGILRKIVPLWLSWFKPGFHPWDHDNAHELAYHKKFLNS